MFAEPFTSTYRGFTHRHRPEVRRSIPKKDALTVSDQVRPRVQKASDVTTSLSLASPEQYRWPRSASVEWGRAAVVAASAMTVVTGLVPGELAEYTGYYEARNTFSHPAIDVERFRQLINQDGISDFIEPAVEWLFAPSIEQSLKISAAAAQIALVGMFGILCYEGDEGEMILEAGPSGRTLTFLFKTDEDVALYRKDPADYTNVTARSFSPSVTLAEIASVAQEYLREVNG